MVDQNESSPDDSRDKITEMNKLREEILSLDTMTQHRWKGI